MGLKMRVGIVGYGNLGQFLVAAVESHDSLELAFVWNRSPSALANFSRRDLILENLSDFESRNADLIVEVSHPDVVKQWGNHFLKRANFMIGSPTALSDKDLETELQNTATSGPYGLYIPSGALWGAEDIKKMADRGTLKALKITMRKHPQSFKLRSELKEINDKVVNTPTILYNGCVRDLCPLAPNNVNTMAAAAVAGHNLGFDEVNACLISDPSLKDSHIVQVDVLGPGDLMAAGKAFQVKTVKNNPAQKGAVTGSETFNSFLSSLLAARGRGPGVHMC